MTTKSKKKSPSPAKKNIRETELYAPVKALLEAKGYEVKAEVGACDVVAITTGQGLEDASPIEPLIVELKTSFTLTLLQQAAERLLLSPQVYIAIPRQKGRTWWRTYLTNKRICRSMGIGMILVTLSNGKAEIMAEPGPYKARITKRKQDRLLREFFGRTGDPNVGGSTQTKIVTAYRQSAIRCAEFLKENGPSKGAEVAKACDVANATRLMAANHYGWFERVEKGIYDLNKDANFSEV